MEQEMIHINRSALFTDETENYRCPAECDPGDTVQIYFRTEKGNVSAVYLRSLGEEYRMEKVRTEGRFDYYRHEQTIGEEPFVYGFCVVSLDGRETCYYDRRGVREESEGRAVFELLPGHHAPQWPRGKIFYQIFTDRFYNGDPYHQVIDDEYAYVNGLHVERVGDWYSYPEDMDVHRFYGGDLQGIWDKLDYLQGLGVEVLYLNPIFVSPSNHKYDTQDYSAVDPHLGKLVYDEGRVLSEEEMDNRQAERYINRVTRKENLEASNAFFARFCEEIHARGMRIILDGVFNHCGSFHKWMDREGVYDGQEGYAPGAYRSKESPYRDYFAFGRDEWPENKSYEGWWNYDTLPKLNYEGSLQLQQDILDAAVKWLSPPYNVDGWRLDVAADLGHSSEFNHRFWQKFRDAVKAVDPEKLILAEHYGDASTWLLGDQWDSLMNYDGFMEPVTWFLTGMEKHSDRRDDRLYNNGEYFFQAMMWNLSRLPVGSALCAMNELSNHDHSRFLTRTNRVVGRMMTVGSKAAEEGIDKAVFREAVIIQMSWPGAPTLYYGDEAGLCGFTDPDNRRSYPWGREDLELIEFHRYAIAVHKENPALTDGSVKPLTSEYGLIAYGRFKPGNQLAVVVNNGEEREVRIPVWEIGVQEGDLMERLIETGPYGYNVGRMGVKVEDGCLKLKLPARTAAIYRRKKRADV
ncbi:MAG: glycoside hydrolase family 13 protein [Lachnospiraceae bacterium]|nr:glycoside hydrolase family 13 protein [Lachnospiraceae bacterium]